MSQAETDLFRRGATRLIALHGGWNARSRRAVLWLAARHGIPAAEIASVLTSQHVIESPALAEATSTSRSAALRGSPAPRDRNTGLLTVLFTASIVSLILTAGIAVIVLPPALRGEGRAAIPSVIKPEPEGSSVPIASAGALSGARTEESDALAGLGSGVAIEEVAGNLATAFDRLATQRAAASADKRREQFAVLTAATGRLLADPQHAERAVEVLERAIEPIVGVELGDSGGVSARELGAAMLAAEVLDSLDQRRLSAWTGQRIRTMAGALGADRDRRRLVASAMRAGAEAIATPADGPGAGDRIERANAAWREWLSLVDIAAGNNSARRSEFLVSGLGVLTRQAPDASGSLAATSAIRAIAGAMSWDERSAEREWFVRAVLDDSVSSEELYLITGAMVTSSAPGVDTTMVVPRDAGAGQRREFLERFMSAWGLTASVEMMGFTSRWQEAASSVQRGARFDGEAEPRGSIVRAAMLATLSAAASAAAEGEYELADELLTLARSQQSRASQADDPQPEAFSPATDEFSGGWAMEFLSLASDANARLTMVRRIPGTPDPVDSEVLVEAALRDPSSQVRAAAADRVRLLGSEPAIVNALLEAAPSMPRSALSSSLVADVTITPQLSTSDPKWRARLRLTLVERLHELIGLRSHGSVIDEAAGELATRYAQRTGAASGSGDPVIEAAALLSEWLRRLDSGGSGERADRRQQIEANLARRLAIARSDPQRLVCYQRAIGESMALWLEAERPDRAARAAELLELAGERLDRARHVLTQIEVLEQLAFELWLLRLEDRS